MELQRVLHRHCIGETMPAKPGATVESQKELLGTAAVGKRWLVVLDDVSFLLPNPFNRRGFKSDGMHGKLFQWMQLVTSRRNFPQLIIAFQSF